MSAIPWIGQDVVETLWTPNILFMYTLPVIGVINWSKIHHGRTQPLSQTIVDKLLLIPYNVLARFVGIIDAEGTISINPDNGYIRIFLKISMHSRDLGLLQEVRESMLNIGVIHRVDANGKVSWVISRTDLQEILFPLMIYHNLFFLVLARHTQYHLAIYVLETGLLQWTALQAALLNIHTPTLPSTPAGFIALPIFNVWLVGFVIGDGSFHVKANLDACFSLSIRV
jgi:hypothetical protein